MARKKKAEWVNYDKDEIMALITKLSREGHSSAKIGIILRDQYGIPDAKRYGIRISSVNKREMPEDMTDLLKKAVVVHEHLARNKKDAKAKVGLQRLEDKIRGLGKYYVRVGKLPKGWGYTIERAKMLVKKE